MNKTQTLEILEIIKSLPPEKIGEIRDFAVFLHQRYGKPEIIDESDEWTEEDLQDVVSTTLKYADERVTR